jgi:AN1-type zinc finger and ubiquitin domain-containing protein 1
MTDIMSMQLDNIICQKKSNLNRCYIDGCTKKLGLIPFICRCEKEFCTKHRIPETHNCMFDYKTNGKKLLDEQNKCITFVKILKI